MDLCEFFNNFCQCLTEDRKMIMMVMWSRSLIDLDPAPTREVRNTRPVRLRFHATLGEEPKVELALV